MPCHQKHRVKLSIVFLFPTRLLTSEDEYKWYWHQMIYFPETINTVSTWIYIHRQCIHFYLLAEHNNSLCACWHLKAVKGSSSSSSCRLLISPCITSYPFPCPGSTDALCSRLWGPVPPFPKMASLFTGSAHTPFHGSTTLLNCEFSYHIMRIWWKCRVKLSISGYNAELN